MIQIAGVLLKLPDGRVILNRRSKTAPVSASLLALYGGHIEKNETPIAAASRELSEETSLAFDVSEIKPLAKFKRMTDGGPRIFHVFELMISSEKFDVYEGDGSEVYTIKEALAREDITASCRKTIQMQEKASGA